MNRRQALAGAAAFAFGGCADASEAHNTPFPMRRGINIGGALEAEREGEWGYTIQGRHLAAIAAAGFDGVRLPVRWDIRTSTAAPYPIDPAYITRVREVVDQALAVNLMVQLDVHHFSPLTEGDNPLFEYPRFRAIWRQIAEHFAYAPAGLIFEPLNEPHGEYWTNARVTEIQQMAVTEIRPSNPERLVVVGGPNWNSIDGLRGWTPPEDPHLAVTAHYYEPFDFTHQNAEFGQDQRRYDRVWGTEADIEAVRDHIAQAARYAQQMGLALQIGEFGVNRRVPVAERALWLRAVRDACEAVGAAWAAYDFATTFEVFNQDSDAFVPELVEALLG